MRLVALFATTAVLAACAADFDTSRKVEPRGSVGRELYGVLCDRVGAQAFREDVSGESFHGLCHPDANGKYSDRLDVSLLPPLGPTTTADGTPVPMEVQEQGRTHRIARMETLARRREELIEALDFSIPDEKIPRCGAEGYTSLQAELAGTLGRLVDLYNDGTMPAFTRAMGKLLVDLKADPQASDALARVEARRGYRPLEDGIGLARPVLAYPGLAPLAQSMLAVLAKDPRLDKMLAVGYHELRTAEPTPAIAPLTLTLDSVDDRELLSRPRTTLEAARSLLITERPKLAGDPAFLVRRDPRGYAALNKLVPPFVDRTGPGGVPDGLPDVDALGRFVTDGASYPAPFFEPGETGPRDGFGRAMKDGEHVYKYLDARSTLLGAVIKDARPFFEADPSRKKEGLMNLLSALPLLLGPRVDAAAGYGDEKLSYKGFDAEQSPLVDLTYAAGQLMAEPIIDEILIMAKKLALEKPEQLASLVGLLMEVKEMGAQHPEAELSPKATFWDDMIPTLARVGKKHGLLADTLRAFADPRSLPMEKALATFLEYKDDISYDRDNLNGPSMNLTRNIKAPVFVTPVDRTQPDVGENRSAFQKFLSLLHDTKGLAICTKEDAVVHIKAVLPNTVIPIEFDYPTNRTYTPLICGIVGQPAPTKLSRCQVFGYVNVMELLMGVLLDEAVLTVRDPCLNALMNSPLTGIVGGADAFLEEISGVKGFSLHPNMRGFARLLYFETPFPGLPADPGNTKTSNFLKDTVDPIESMVCDLQPVTYGGTTFPLRKCNTVNDVLRARDRNALFPVDELGFVPSLRPIASAFKKHDAAMLFADLWDTLHLHWGSPRQTPDVCDPNRPRTDARWCGQDGIVNYEPLLVEMLKTGVFERLQKVVRALGDIKVPHCTARGASGACTAKTDRDGIEVVGDALELVLDQPAKDRRGNDKALRNDGTRTDPQSPITLLTEALAGMDAALDSDPFKKKQWKAARSQLADLFLSVDGKGDTAKFKSPTLLEALPALIDLVRAQVFAHCKGSAQCKWAKEDLTRSLEQTLRGPAVAAGLDVVDAVVSDEAARSEMAKLIHHLFGDRTLLAAVVDLMQLMQDDANFVPLERFFARALVPDGMADAAIGLMSRMFEKGNGACTLRDPNLAIPAILARLVTPRGEGKPSAIEVIGSVMGDVNRQEPGSGKKLEGGDYAKIADEVSEFLLDPSRGLEQMYAVVREATR
jgi:hypothetical protein